MEQPTRRNTGTTSSQAACDQPKSDGASSAATPTRVKAGSTWADKIAAREAKNLVRK